MSPGSVTERLHVFVGAYSVADTVSEGGGNRDEGEDIERLDPTIEEALAMVADGRIRDGKTIMLLQYAALHIFRETHAHPESGETRHPSAFARSLVLT